MIANSAGGRTGFPEDAVEPLVILPGLLCDARMFGSQEEALAAQVVGNFYDGMDRLEAMAAFAIERLPRRCALLGHSMGARVALEVWRQAPERVTRLALADTGVHAVRPGEADARNRLLMLGRKDGVEALVDAWLPPMVSAGRRGDAALMQALRAMCVDAGLGTYARQVHALLHRPDAEAILSTITCPTLVIVGAQDAWSPVEQHEQMAAAISGARLRVVPDAGHMAPAENSTAFNDFVREWLTWPAGAQLSPA